jgi:hypothetical protein
MHNEKDTEVVEFKEIKKIYYIFASSFKISSHF